MRITPNEFVELQNKYPNSKVKVNQLLILEERVDMLLVHFRGKGYEVWYPTNTFHKEVN